MGDESGSVAGDTVCLYPGTYEMELGGYESTDHRSLPVFLVEFVTLLSRR